MISRRDVFNGMSSVVSDEVIKNNRDLDHFISFDFRSVYLGELLKICSGKSGLVGKILIEPENYSFTVDIRINRMKISDFMILIKDFYGGEWIITNGVMTLVLSNENRKIRKKWWSLYLSERKINLERLSSVRYKSFSVDGEDGRFWGSLSSEIKNIVAQDIDDNQYWKLQFTKANNFKPGNKSINFPLSNINSMSLNYLMKQVMEFQEIKERNEINEDWLVLNYTKYFAKISIMKKDGKILDSGVNNVIQYSKNSIDRDNTFFSQGIGSDLLLQALQLDHKYLLNSVNFIDQINLKKKDLRIPKGWRELIEFQKTKFWTDTNDTVDSPISLDLAPRRSQIIKELAKNSDFEFISDCYNYNDVGIKQGFLKPEEIRDFEKTINKYKYNWDVSVKKSEKIILIRNNRWYRDDLLGVDRVFCDYVYDTSLDLEKIITGISNEREDRIFNEKFLGLMLEICMKLSIKQINVGLYYFMPEVNVFGKYSGDIPVFPLAYISDFIMSNYDLLQFLLSIGFDKNKKIMEDGLEIDGLNQIQKSKLWKMVPVFIGMKNIYDNSSKVRMVVGVGDISRSVSDVRLVYSSIRLASKKFDLVFSVK